MTSTFPLAVDDLEVLRRRRSAKWRLNDPDVLPLPVAEMDFALAPPVQEVLRQAVEASDTGYAYPAGTLGQALAEFAQRRWGWRIDPDRTAVATDVGVAAVDLLRVLCAPGDRVVINPPVYHPFFAWIDEVSAERVEVPLRLQPGTGWRLDLAGLEAAFAAGARVFLLCNPHNPVGRVHSEEELVEVARLAAEYDVTVLADEVHGPLVLPGATFTPFLTVRGGAEVGISMVAASKAWNLAGLKCAQIVAASEPMVEIVRRRPEIAGWRVGHFGVLASVAAFTHGVDWLDTLLDTLDRRRLLLGELLAERLPQVRWTPPEAT